MSSIMCITLEGKVLIFFQFSEVDCFCVISVGESSPDLSLDSSLDPSSGWYRVVRSLHWQTKPHVPSPASHHGHVSVLVRLCLPSVFVGPIGLGKASGVRSDLSCIIALDGRSCALCVTCSPFAKVLLSVAGSVLLEGVPDVATSGSVDVTSAETWAHILFFQLVSAWASRASRAHLFALCCHVL